MTRNISTAPILKTQDLIMTIMTGYIVHSKATNQVRQAVRPRLQVPLLRQQLQHVSYSQYKNGIHV